MKQINLGLIGFGTVGSKAVELIQLNKHAISQKIGAEPVFKYCCDINTKKLSQYKSLLGKQCILTSSWEKVVADPSVNIVIELIGGKELAYKIITESIKQKKHIVTANKALLSEYWDTLFTLARVHKSLIYFEAAVGAGIPIIEALNEGLAGNKISQIAGILNGTTNYILTQMFERSIDFDIALKNARKSGFAETDPSLDINGFDTAHKLSILSSIAFSNWIKPDSFYIEGIQNIRLIDIKYAHEQFGYKIKLLGIAKQVNNKVLLEVRPYLIAGQHQFSSVNNEFNAILVDGNACGEIMFYGKGAGGYPAASAVVSDIIFLARQIANKIAGNVPYVAYDQTRKIELIHSFNTEGKFYLRFIAEDKPGVLSKIADILAKHKVSIAGVYQKENISAKRRGGVPLILITHNVLEKAVRKSIEQIALLPVIKSKTVLNKIK